MRCGSPLGFPPGANGATVSRWRGAAGTAPGLDGASAPTLTGASRLPRVLRSWGAPQLGSRSSGGRIPTSVAARIPADAAVWCGVCLQIPQPADPSQSADPAALQIPLTPVNAPVGSMRLAACRSIPLTPANALAGSHVFAGSHARQVVFARTRINFTESGLTKHGALRSDSPTADAASTAYKDRATAGPAYKDPAGVDPSSVDPAGVDPSSVDPAGVDPSGVDPADGAGPPAESVDGSRIQGWSSSCDATEPGLPEWRDGGRPGWSARVALSFGMHASGSEDGGGGTGRSAGDRGVTEGGVHSDAALALASILDAFAYRLSAPTLETAVRVSGGAARGADTVDQPPLSTAVVGIMISGALLAALMAAAACIARRTQHAGRWPQWATWHRRVTWPSGIRPGLGEREGQTAHPAGSGPVAAPGCCRGCGVLRRATATPCVTSTTVEAVELRLHDSAQCCA